MSNSFQQYQELKALIGDKSYKGYPLAMVLGSYLAELSWKYKHKKVRRYASLVVKNQIELKSEDNIVTYTVERKDYKNLLTGYFPSITPQSVRLKRNTARAIVNIPYNLSYLAKARKLIVDISCTAKQRIILLSCISLALKIIDELETKEIECKAYYAFNSSFLVESFLSFYFKKRGIKTHSLQHGMYFNFISAPPMDIINFENCCADELLLWGEFSKQQISHLLPKSVTTRIVGHPFINREEIANQTPSEAIYVLLPRSTYWHQSTELLNILTQKSDTRIIIRPHPNIKDKLAEFIQPFEHISIDKESGSSQLMLSNRFKAVIAFNSTMVFEALALNQNLLYFDQSSEMDSKGFQCFRDQVKLEEWLKKVSNCATDSHYFYANDVTLTP